MQSQLGGWHSAHVHLLGQGVVVHKGEFTTDLAIKTDVKTVGLLAAYTSTLLGAYSVGIQGLKENVSLPWSF